MNNSLALFSVFHYMVIILLTSESTNAQYTVKRNPKFDIKKDVFSSYHEPDLFALDTLAGIGLGKRSKPQEVARFQPSPVSMNENSFRFLDSDSLEAPIWKLFEQLNQRIPENPNTPRGQMEMVSVDAPKFNRQLSPGV